jgi:hypothetical protein
MLLHKVEEEQAAGTEAKLRFSTRSKKNRNRHEENRLQGQEQ